MFNSESAELLSRVFFFFFQCNENPTADGARNSIFNTDVSVNVTVSVVITRAGIVSRMNMPYVYPRSGKLNLEYSTYRPELVDSRFYNPAKERI